MKIRRYLRIVARVVPVRRCTWCKRIVVIPVNGWWAHVRWGIPEFCSKDCYDKNMDWLAAARRSTGDLILKIKGLMADRSKEESVRKNEIKAEPSHSPSVMLLNEDIERVKAAESNGTA